MASEAAEGGDQREHRHSPHLFGLCDENFEERKIAFRPSYNDQVSTKWMTLGKRRHRDTSPRGSRIFEQAFLLNKRSDFGETDTFFEVTHHEWASPRIFLASLSMTSREAPT